MPAAMGSARGKVRRELWEPSGTWAKRTILPEATMQYTRKLHIELIDPPKKMHNNHFQEQ